MFTYGSICSGIEAVTVAWEGLGKPLWFSEIEPFPCALLAHHYPDIPNLGDMTTLAERILKKEIPAPDVLVGGTPCQAFSVAGLRHSLDDDRGNLTLQLIHILEAIDYVRHQHGQPPCVLVWENVPGVLSTKDNAFGHFLAGLAQECEPLQPTGKKWSNAGYVHSARTIAWRILDAQYFGLAQRRKRVFLVASARKRSIAEILLEQKSVRGDFKTSGSSRETSTPTPTTSPLASGKSTVGTLLANCGNKQWLGNQEAFSGDFFVIHGTQDPIISTDTAHCLGRNNGGENVLFEIKGQESVRLHENITPTLKARMGTGGNNVPCIVLNDQGGQSIHIEKDCISPTLRSEAHGNLPIITTPYTIRKLTPTECERLQGFPDNYTQIPWRNKPAEDCPDSPRYKAIGNSMAVPVMRWIGQRLTAFLEK